jgi:hypothetical protein
MTTLPTGNARVDVAIGAMADFLALDWRADSAGDARQHERRLRDFLRPESYDAGKRTLARLRGWPEALELRWVRSGGTWHLIGDGDGVYRSWGFRCSETDPRDALIAALLSIT